MNTKTNLLLVAMATVAVCATTSCSHSGENDSPEFPKYITVDTQIGNSITRTVIDDDGSEAFSEGDVISVYSWLGSGTEVASSLVVNNSLNTLTNGSWIPSPQMLWNTVTASHYFLSVYPSRKITDFTADPFALTDDENANDLLVAVNATGITATSNPVTLVFNHVMAKLIVNLTYRSQWESTPTVAGVVAQAASAATVNYLASSSITATGDVTDIALQETKANEQYSSIMIPQDQFQRILITTGEQTFTFDNGSPISLVSGKVTTINLIVGRDKITAESVSITDWVDNDIIYGGEAL